MFFISNIIYNSFIFSLFDQQTMKRNQKSLEQSQPGSTRTDFEFPASTFGELPNDVVFCGKVITRKTEPGPAPQTKRDTAFVVGNRTSSGVENRYRRCRSERKSYNGMFGTAKFPLQMELSDIKMRQERREPVALPKFPAEDGGGESCWELVRPLRRRGTFMSALMASFGCIHIV